MINVHGNYWIPSEGYKYITNGTSWSDGIYLGRLDSIDNWHDTNDEPYDEPEQAEIDDALVRYSNELTEAHDGTLEEATERLIKLNMEE